MAIRPLLTEIAELWPEYRNRGLVDRTSRVFHGQASHAAAGRGATSQNEQRGVALRGAGGFAVAPGTNAPHNFADCRADKLPGGHRVELPLKMQRPTGFEPVG
jgi:hypothetical protein